MLGLSRIRFFPLAAAIGILSAGHPLSSAGPTGTGPAAWAGDLAPITTADWNPERAAHLLERAGFGGTPEDVARIAALSPKGAIDFLVDYDSLTNNLRPFDESGIWDPGMDPFPPSRAEAVRIAREKGEHLGVRVLPIGAQRRLQPVVDKFFYSLQANAIETQRLGVWWANRMLVSNRPLEEKMTLFWHGHFATGENKVRDARMMRFQNEMFRANATGSFRNLLVGVMKDPGMLNYLDNGENIKSHPNENFGRELLELFTMGVGNYTEKDVREAARAFTGWTNDALTFKFDAAQHDFGTKTFLGQTGTFDGLDIIDIILKQPVTAEYMAGKIYKYFVREEVPASLRVSLGKTFRDARYELKPLLRQIFLSRDFYSAPAMATQIKAPVPLVISTYKKMGLTELPTIPDFGRLTSSLGQSLFDPPNVAGWPGGKSWITPSTLLQRGNIFRGVLFPDVKNFRPPDRTMAAGDLAVGDRVARGMDITEATRDPGMAPEMVSETNAMVDRDEEYNTRYGGFKGGLMALERTKPIPRKAPNLDLAAMVRTAGATTTDQVVDHFIGRFLSVPLSAKDRASLVAFINNRLGSTTIRPAGKNEENEKLEESLRELLYLVLSTPAYQLG